MKSILQSMKKQPLVQSAPVQTQLTLFNPPLIVAGVAPIGPKEEYRPAYYALSEVLSDDVVRFIYTKHKGRIYYLGARERDFTVAGRVGSLLAAALPGSAGHQGEGAYLVNQGEAATVVVFKDGSLECRNGNLPDVLRWIESKNIPTHKMESLAYALPWQSDAKIARETTAKFFKVGYLAAAVPLAFFILSGIGLAITQATTKPSLMMKKEALEADLNALARDLEKSKEQPIRQQLADMQRILDVALNNSGAVVRLEFDGSKYLYVLDMPVFVPASQFVSLGGDARVFLNEQKTAVVVTNDPKITNPGDFENVKGNKAAAIVPEATTTTATSPATEVKQ